MNPRISKEKLTQFLINYHNLNELENYRNKEGVMSYLNRVRTLQYDPLDVVGRNADLVLQSKIKNYKAEMLESLLYKDHALIDGFDKEMCIYITEDYSFFWKVRAANAERTIDTLNHHHQLEALDLIEEIRIFIKKNGKTASNNISIGGNQKNQWGHKKLSTAALDYLYRTGDLCVVDKKGVRKYYDFTSKVLSEKHTKNHFFENEEAFLDWYIKRRIKSVGVLWDKQGGGWLGHYISDHKTKKLALKRLYEQGELLRFSVEGIKNYFYMAKEDIKFFDYKETEKKVKFLAPLDNMLWDREMLYKLFDFKYRWEVYTPLVNRKYGYYVLPVIYGNQFIGRFEPKKIDSNKVLIIKKWWWEAKVEITSGILEAIDLAITEFAAYLGVTRKTDYSDVIHQNNPL